MRWIADVHVSFVLMGRLDSRTKIQSRLSARRLSLIQGAFFIALLQLSSGVLRRAFDTFGKRFASSFCPLEFWQTFRFSSIVVHGPDTMRLILETLQIFSFGFSPLIGFEFRFKFAACLNPVQERDRSRSKNHFSVQFTRVLVPHAGAVWISAVAIG